MSEDPHSYYKNTLPRGEKSRAKFQEKLVRALVHILAWTGIAILYYIAFSFFFDTPVEYRMKQHSRLLREEYQKLNERYDTLEKVLNYVIERDKNVFRTLFESEPYNFDADFEKKKWEAHEALLSQSNKELGDEFFAKLNNLTQSVAREHEMLNKLGNRMDSLQDKLNYLPAIQPVVNPDLTLLTASYGMRIHPFYKSLTAHQGVDFTVGEGSRVFATADGRISDVITRRTSSGNTIVIDHGNGYSTAYSHLGKIYVRKGQIVRRGDIIAQSGNTGLSLAPHLHYEVRHNGMRVDPIHYFFLELDYNQYQKMMKIAQSGMQSFD